MEYTQRYSTEARYQATASQSTRKWLGLGDGKTLRVVPIYFAHSFSLSQKRTGEEQPCSDTSSTPGAGPRYRPAGRRGMCRWEVMILWRRRTGVGMDACRWNRGYCRRSLAGRIKAQVRLYLISWGGRPCRDVFGRALCQTYVLSHHFLLFLLPSPLCVFIAATWAWVPDG